MNSEEVRTIEEILADIQSKEKVMREKPDLTKAFATAQAIWINYPGCMREIETSARRHGNCSQERKKVAAALHDLHEVATDTLMAMAKEHESDANAIYDSGDYCRMQFRDGVPADVPNTEITQTWPEYLDAFGRDHARLLHHDEVQRGVSAKRELSQLAMILERGQTTAKRELPLPEAGKKLNTESNGEKGEKESKTKGKKINAKMLEAITSNPEIIWRSADDWAKLYRCSPGTVHDTEAWTKIMDMRALFKAERESEKIDHRRHRKRKGRQNSE